TRPWTRGQHPLLDLWLSVNEKPLEMLSQAAARQRMHLPAVYDNDDPHMLNMVTPSTAMYREAAKLLLTRAMSRLERSDHEGAWDDVRSCYRLASLIGQEPSVMAMITSGAVESITHDIALMLAVEGGLSASHLRSCIAELGG